MDFTNNAVDTILRSVIDDEKEQHLNFEEKVDILLVEQGTKAALTETNPAQATAIATALVAATGNVKVTEFKGNLIRKIDDTGIYTYIGLAVPQSVTSAAVFQIKRIDTLGNVLFAGGVATFTQIWDNRASLSYS